MAHHIKLKDLTNINKQNKNSNTKVAFDATKFYKMAYSMVTVIFLFNLKSR